MISAKVILILCFLGLTRCAPKRGTNAHSVQYKTHVMSDDGSHGSQKENVNNTVDKNPEIKLNSHNLSKNFVNNLQNKKSRPGKLFHLLSSKLRIKHKGNDNPRYAQDYHTINKRNLSENQFTKIRNIKMLSDAHPKIPAQESKRFQDGRQELIYGLSEIHIILGQPVESLKETSTTQSETSQFLPDTSQFQPESSYILPEASQFQPESSYILPETSQFQPLTSESAYYTTENPSLIPQTTSAPWQAPVETRVPKSQTEIFPPMEVPDTSEDVYIGTFQMCSTSDGKKYPTSCYYCYDCSKEFYCKYADCQSQQCADFVVSPGSCCAICPNGPNCWVEATIVPMGQTVRFDNGTECSCVYGNYDVVRTRCTALVDGLPVEYFHGPSFVEWM